MSIINNVLKSLESRSSHFTPIQFASVASGGNDKKYFTKNHLIVVLSFVLASVFLITFPQHWGAPLEAAYTVESASKIPDRALPGPQAAMIVPAPENQITGLQINESVNELNLEFLLGGKVISYLKERSENSFIYHLKGIKNAIVAPLIKDNRWIEQLSIDKSGDGVDIRFRTANEILVETRQLVVADEQLWTIKFKKMIKPEKASQQAARLAQSREPASIPANKNRLPSTPEKTQEIAVQDKPDIVPRVVRLDIKSTNNVVTESNQLRQINRLVKNKQWAAAEAGLITLISGEEAVEARKLLLMVYLAQKRDDQFSALARESILLYPDQAEFRTEYAKSLYSSQAYEAVIELIQQSPNKDAKQSALIAASFQRLDQHQYAVKHYKNSLQIDERQSRNWIGLGISQEHTGELKSALSSYGTALRLGRINDRLLTFVRKRSQLLEKAIN